MLKKLNTWVRKISVIRNIKRIESRDFSIIASNCTGALPYRFLAMPNTSPTVNLFFYAPCYIKFASRLDHYLNSELQFVERSSYAEAEKVHSDFNRYPIGVLDDIEIHFMHYSSEEDARDKWLRRSKRINRNKLLFAFTDRDLCTPELMEAFDRLPGRKILLTAQTCPWIKSAITVPAYHGQSEMGDGYTNYHTLSHINYKRLIDGPADLENAELYAALPNSSSA